MTAHSAFSFLELAIRKQTEQKYNYNRDFQYSVVNNSIQSVLKTTRCIRAPILRQNVPSICNNLYRQSKLPIFQNNNLRNLGYGNNISL